nr:MULTISPECIES: OmpA family protein [Mesorhizobium]
MKLRPNERVTIREFKRRPDLRRMARSIDIQSINFGFGLAAISSSQYDKIENIADALQRILRRDPGARADRRTHRRSRLLPVEPGPVRTTAASLKRTLVREFCVPGYALETVGYGEEFLLVPTQNENWQHRRVTLRRFDDFIR